ncbi:hypothetical protein [Aureimonas psammosilenae]|uniref:hypothetical protein n=1 Tax=Aureimonas psammosilenae TaxID=2495496 RepID=UPI001260EBF3|nr:hypothetical protein [Aureimonas psammosilenae]
MMRSILALASVLVALPAAAAPAAEKWSATSTTAMSITGDITLSPTQLKAAGKTWPLKVAGDTRTFGTDRGPQRARILEVVKPSNPKLLNGNTLCAAPVRWIVVYQSDAGSTLHLAAFTGSSRPTGEDGPGLCGTFLFSR